MVLHLKCKHDMSTFTLDDLLFRSVSLSCYCLIKDVVLLSLARLHLLYILPQYILVTCTWPMLFFKKIVFPSDPYCMVVITNPLNSSQITAKQITEWL